MRETSFNAGPGVDQYIRFTGSPARSAWCSCFVSWCLHQGGVLTARFGRARDWFDARHVIWHRGRGQPPQPGDLTGYEWGADHVSHVGIIKQWPPGPSAVTLEGNTHGHGLSREGDGVFENWRDKRQITYVADVISRPAYSHTY